MNIDELFQKVYNLINSKVVNDLENNPLEYGDILYFVLKNNKNIENISFCKETDNEDFPNHHELIISCRQPLWMSVFFTDDLDYNKVYKILELIISDNNYLIYRVLRNYKVISSKYYYNYEKDFIGEDDKDTHITYIINKDYELIDITTVQLIDRIKLNLD